MGPYRESSIVPSRRLIVFLLVTALLILLTPRPGSGQTAPTGEVAIAWHVTIAPSWFDPVDGAAADHAVRDPVRAPRRARMRPGGYPDIDDLFQQQSRERDAGRREGLLHRIQQLTIDRVMFAPIMDYRTLRGVGPRIADHMLDAMPLVPFPAYEDVRLKTP